MGRIPTGTRKTKSGAYEKRFTVDGVRYSVTGRTAAELHEKEEAKRQQIKAGLITSKKNITLNEYFGEWIEHKKKEIKEKTVFDYERLYRNHVKDRLGEKKLKDINRLTIKKYIDELHGQNSAPLTNHSITLLKQMFKEAKIDRIIINNPVEDIKRVRDDNKGKARETIHRALTDYEIKVFFKAIADSTYEPILLFMINTGVRVGEAQALTWNDINYFTDTVSINKTATIKGKTSSPKSRTSIRNIPLNEGAKEALKKTKRICMLISACEVIPNDSLVFRSVRNKRFELRDINQFIIRKLEMLNAEKEIIPHFSTHAMRDTFATRFIESGGNPKTLQEILGHSTFAMTMDLYAHVLPDTKVKEMGKMQAVL